MSPEERTAAFVALVDDGLTFSEVVNIYGADQSDGDKATATQAREEWTREGQIEVDEGAFVSRGDDPGAYVMAWVWVDDPEQDEEEEAP